MTLKPKALVLAILFVLLALPVLADQRPGQRPGNPSVDPSALTNPRFLARYLNLTPAQITQTQGFLKTLQTALQAVQATRAPLCQHLRTDLGVSSPDPATVGRGFLALVNNQAGGKGALQGFYASLSGILDSDKLAPYDVL